MKIKITAFATAIIMASCAGHTNTQSAESKEATDSTTITADTTDIADNTSEWKFKKPVENIAQNLWDKYFKQQHEKNKDNESITVDLDTTIDNVIRHYYTTTQVEYEEGGMVNVFDKYSIACYENQGFWNVVELYLGECSDGNGYDGYLKFYRYENGKLTPNNDDIDAKVLTMGFDMSWNEEPNMYTCQNEVKFGNSYFVIVPNEHNQNEEGNIIQPTAMNFNGKSFESSPATFQQYISEEDLFKLVANMRPEMKGQEIPFDFNDGYCDWKDFEMCENSFSYGRYAIQGEGYSIYLRITPQNGSSKIYKYAFTNGELTFISDKDAFTDLGIDASEASVVTFYSNPYNCYVSIGDKYLSWDGKHFHLQNYSNEPEEEEE